MKKILLIGIMIVFGLQSFSFSPGNSSLINTSYTLPHNLNAMALKQFLTLTPKQYQQLTGKRMTLKQKITFSILRWKLKKQLPDDKAQAHKTDIGLLSLIFGAGAFVIAFIPAVGVASFGLAIAAIILGIIGLGRKKGDTKSIIGLVLGSAFLLLVIVLIAAFTSSGWY